LFAAGRVASVFPAARPRWSSPVKQIWYKGTFLVYNTGRIPQWYNRYLNNSCWTYIDCHWSCVVGACLVECDTVQFSRSSVQYFCLILWNDKMPHPRKWLYLYPNFVHVCPLAVSIRVYLDFPSHRHKSLLDQTIWLAHDLFQLTRK
jgi:hypothetical protein